MATNAGPLRIAVPRVLEEQRAQRLVIADPQRPGVLRLVGQHHLEIGGQPQPPVCAAAIPHGQQVNAHRLVAAARTPSARSRASARVMLIRGRAVDAELGLVAGRGVAERMICRRVPLPTVRDRRGRTPLPGTSRVTVSGQSGVRRFCCELTLDVVCSPRLVTTTMCPSALDIV